MPTKVCRYIRTNGERCGSPALNSEVFCYYHVQLGKRHRGLNARPENSRLEPIETIIHPMTLQDGTQREPLTAEYFDVQAAVPLQLDFPPLEDRHSIQLALSMLITALAQDRIDPRRAAMLLYGLQVASANAKDLTPSLPPNRRAGKVRETVLDASGILIAPDEDPEGEEDYQRPGSVARFLEKMEKEHAEKERKAAEAAKASPPPTAP
jgi:hypothetical protein